MAVVRADPAELWGLYCVISDMNQEIAEQCQNDLRTLESLKEQLEEKGKRTEREIAALEGALTQLKNKMSRAEELGMASHQMEEVETAIKGRIESLEAQLTDIEIYLKKSDSFRSQMEAEKKQCILKLRKSSRKVNRYAQFLEALLFEQDYAVYHDFSGEMTGGNHKSGFHKMEFRGTIFCCTEEIDPNTADSKGRTNLQRMQKGLAPIGPDGLPMKLSYTRRPGTGAVMDSAQTAFHVLKSAYWKRIGAFMARETVSWSVGIVTKMSSAENVNNWWKTEMGCENPPYKPDTQVYEMKLTQDTAFVRVYDKKVAKQRGGWMMKKEDIEGLTPEEMKDRFALPARPKYATDVILPKGTTIRGGIANSLADWGNGGGIQYDLMGKRAGKFVNERLLI